MIIGAAFIPKLSLQLHPSTTLPSMRISYHWHEASAINIEREITSKLEGAISSITDVQDISSVSTYGRGYIDLTIKKQANVENIRFEIASMIRRIYHEFPDGVSYPDISLSRISGNKNPLLSYTVFAPYPSQSIDNYIQRIIVPSVSNINGVENITVYGAQPYEYQVVYESETIERYNISVENILTAISDYFSDTYIGTANSDMSDNTTYRGLPVILKTHKSEELWNKIPVASSKGRTIYLTDIANIHYKEQLPQRYYRINGQKTINFVIYPAQGTNQLVLAKQIKETINTIKDDLPSYFNVLLTYDDTEYIIKDLKKIGYRMLFALLILLAFVLIISRNIKYLFLIIVTITANLLLAATLYYWFRIDIHLYSLAGITVSFGIIIDNAIVMIDHLRHQKNKKVFIAILAATFTTIGALSVIFFLSYEQRIQLKDFASVMLINLVVSLIIAWFFVPALQDKIKLFKKVNKSFIIRKKRIIRISKVYLRFIKFSKKFKWIFFILFILSFGIPVHWLPREVQGDSFAAGIYNKTIGSSWYQMKARKTTEKILGGSLRLFSHYVFQHSYYTNPERTTLYIGAQMPDGCSIHQLNETIILMEDYLAGFEEIEQFQTSITAYNNGRISVLFKPEHDRTAFPYYLYNQVIQKAISFGGAEWRVSGVGRGFSNVLGGGGGSVAIILSGYNYEQLYLFAEKLSQKAAENPRATNVMISGGDNVWSTTNRMEYFMSFNEENMTLQNISIIDFYSGLREKISQTFANPVFDGYKTIPVRLMSDRNNTYSVWDLKNEPLLINERNLKTSDLVSIEKRQTGNDVYKFNQQYRLSVLFDYLGPHVPMEKFREKLIEEINSEMPMGYKAYTSRWSWDYGKKDQYYLIILVIIIIYFICSILLESFIQPLAIIGLIPISFIGLFLTFYLFDINFDQGGLAAFILLSGLAVNAGLYILNDYNNFRKQQNNRSLIQTYVKAYNNKIIPVILTISSTVLGLIPFIAGTKEPFWYAFAAGSMGGLLFSFIAIIIYFPIFLKFSSKKQKN